MIVDETQVAEVSERDERVRMVEESATAVLRGDRARARKVRFSDPGFDMAKWHEFRDLGWLILRVSEADGGLGFGVTELCTIARNLGREITPEPVLASAMVAPALDSDLRSALEGGDAVVLPAFSAFGATAPTISGGKLSGEWEAVPFGGAAKSFVVQTNGGGAIVDASAKGVTVTVTQTHDGGHFGTLTLADADVTPIDMDVAALREEAALVLSAYLLGVSESALDITLEYLRDRRQFDKAIGSFQALQHKCVDLFLQLSLLRAAVEAAATAIDDSEDESTVLRKISNAKARASIAVGQITRASIQLHGGIGYTDEADIGLYLRKAMTLSGLLGTERFHRERAFYLSGLMS
jgi:alkylation response protein AidB-like acyl-CoA dehydrogenase